jgi:hypothetical protein
MSELEALGAILGVIRVLLWRSVPLRASSSSSSGEWHSVSGRCESHRDAQVSPRWSPVTAVGAKRRARLAAQGCHGWFLLRLGTIVRGADDVDRAVSFSSAALGIAQSQLSPKGRLIVARKSGHYIQNAQPKLVVDAIVRVVAKARHEAARGHADSAVG